MDALHAASFAGDVGKLPLALQAGVDVDSTDAGSGATALMAACAGGHEAAARLLLEAGAAADWKGTNGETALMVASQHGHEGTVRVLLEVGAAVESKANDGWTALAFAIRRGHLDVARVILETGAELPLSMVDRQFLRPAVKELTREMQTLLAGHWDERRALAAVQRRASREAAEAAAAAAMDALLAEEEAEKSSAESRQAKTKKKKITPKDKARRGVV